MEKNTKTISHKLKFIHSARFMASSLSNIIDNSLKEFMIVSLNMDMIIEIWICCSVGKRGIITWKSRFKREKT